MNIDGWEYDYTTLPYWENRATSKSCNDYLFESPNNEHSCLIYGVIKTEMENNIGFCSIFSQKDSPRLMLNLKYMNIASPAYFSKDGNFLFLKALYRQVVCFVLAIDLRREMYSIIHFTPNDFSYSINENDAGFLEFQFDDPSEYSADFQKIYRSELPLSKMKWKKWTDLENGEDLNLQRRSFFEHFKSTEKIWLDSIEKYNNFTLSLQAFVDKNSKKDFYFLSPIEKKHDGTSVLTTVSRSEFGDTKFLPLYTTLEKCREYADTLPNMEHIFCKGNFKQIYRVLDSDRHTKNMGLVIFFDKKFMVVWPNIRVTAKCLKY